MIVWELRSMHTRKSTQMLCVYFSFYCWWYRQHSAPVSSIQHYVYIWLCRTALRRCLSLVIVLAFVFTAFQRFLSCYKLLFPFCLFHSLHLAHSSSCSFGFAGVYRLNGCFFLNIHCKRICAYDSKYIAERVSHLTELSNKLFSFDYFVGMIFLLRQLFGWSSECLSLWPCPNWRSGQKDHLNSNCFCFCCSYLFFFSLLALKMEMFKNEMEYIWLQCW